MEYLFINPFKLNIELQTMIESLEYVFNFFLEAQEVADETDRSSLRDRGEGGGELPGDSREEQAQGRSPHRVGSGHAHQAVVEKDGSPFLGKA